MWILYISVSLLDVKKVSRDCWSITPEPFYTQLDLIGDHTDDRQFITSKIKCNFKIPFYKMFIQKWITISSCLSTLKKRTSVWDFLWGPCFIDFYTLFYINFEIFTSQFDYSVILRNLRLLLILNIYAYRFVLTCLNTESS